MSNKERINTGDEERSSFDYLPRDGEITPMLQAALDSGIYLSDVIETVSGVTLPQEKNARKRAIASIRQEGLMAQWRAEELRRQGDSAANEVKKIADMVTEVASMYGTSQPGVRREHDEVELEISRNLRQSNVTTEAHWTAFARDSQVVHGKIHKAFGIPSTIEALPGLPLARNSSEEKPLPGLNNAQRAVATVLATAFLSGAVPAMAQAAPETTPTVPEAKSTSRSVVEATNPHDPSDPANLLSLSTSSSKSKEVATTTPAAVVSEQSASQIAPAVTPEAPIITNPSHDDRNDTPTVNTVLQETNNVFIGLTPAPIAVVATPKTVIAPSNLGTPEIASSTPKSEDGIGLVPAPVHATRKSLGKTPASGGTPEVAAPVAPVLPPVEEAAPIPPPAPAPAPKAPESPAPAPKAAEKDPTATDKAFANIVGVNVNVNRHGDKLSAATLTNLLNTSAEKYHHPVITREFILAVLVQESTLDPDIASGAGAVGLAQFIPATAARYGLTNPRDPAAAVDASFHYYTDIYDMLAKKFPGKSQADLVDLTLAGYNAGENNTFIQHGEVPPYPETVGYVKVITAHLQRIYDVENAPPAPVLASQEHAQQTPEKVGNVAYTWQMDPAFFDMKYADGQVVGLTACGAASLDMVANTIGSKPGHGQVMRTMLADGTLPEGGTSQTFLMNEAPKFGLRTEYIQNYSITVMKKVLDAGGLITFSGRANSRLLPAPGHFVVVDDVNVADGTMRVADPGNPANNGKYFSLQAEVNAGAADKANGNMGLHNGFIAYYPTHSVADLASQISPQSTQVNVQPSMATKDAGVETNVVKVDTPIDSTTQQAVDTLKSAVAAAKEAARVKPAAKTIAERDEAAAIQAQIDEIQQGIDIQSQVAQIQKKLN